MADTEGVYVELHVINTALKRKQKEIANDSRFTSPKKYAQSSAQKFKSTV